MREIMFRGKRLDNGKWIEGHLVRCENERTRICESKTDIFCYEKDRSIIQTVAHETETFTVGQYTGLKDKNGKRIFEGDIVRYTFDSPDDPTATENGLKVRTGRIFWSDWRASFAVTAGRNLSAAINNDVAVYVRGRQVYEYVRGTNTVEVIGNVHDNPELLEGDNDGN